MGEGAPSNDFAVAKVELDLCSIRPYGYAWPLKDNNALELQCSGPTPSRSR